MIVTFAGKILTIVMTFIGQNVVAQALSDPHLSIIPRTDDERARITNVTKPTTDYTQANRFEERAAGAATVRARTNANAFSQSSANIPFADELTFKVGNGLFRKLWV